MGPRRKPLRTIAAAAQVAQPGDVITVHEGVYRERVTRRAGAQSDAKRIVYQAAAGEKVVIKGSEVVKGWEKVQNDTWKVVIPNSFFGSLQSLQRLDSRRLVQSQGSQSPHGGRLSQGPLAHRSGQAG